MEIVPAPGYPSLRDLIARLDPAQIQRIQRAVGSELGRRLVDNYRSLTHPVRTGALREGWSFTQPSDQSVQIENPVKYAKTYDEGSRAHMIPLSPGKTVLKFRGKQGIAFRNQVPHPGTKPQNISRRALARTLPSFWVWLNTRIQRAFQGYPA